MYIDECLKDKITYANLEEYLRMEHKLLLSTPTSFILLFSKYNIYMADCVDSECNNLCKELEKYKDINLITVVSDKLFELIKSRFKDNNVSYQAVFTGDIFKDQNLMHLKKEDLDYVKNTYNDGENKNEVEKTFEENDLLGYYENDKLIGFIGRHYDHSIGMLYVKKELRKKGYGSIILKAGFHFWENQVPFSHIIIGNTPSEKLHKKIGCQFGKKKVYWLWNDYD